MQTPLKPYIITQLGLPRNCKHRVNIRTKSEDPKGGRKNPNILLVSIMSGTTLKKNTRTQPQGN